VEQPTGPLLENSDAGELNVSQIRFVAAFVVALIFGSSTSFAFDDAVAVQGMTEGKIAFDITEGNGKGLLNRLEIIDETRRSMIQQGLKPHIIIAFRGPATKLVQTDMGKIALEDRDIAPKIAARIETLSKEVGIESIEQCSVAARELGTNPDNVVPGIKVVGNGYISLMGHQARGYAYIRP
jgi:intracellular sulfur oxidation DsrE/DsrF family protein